MTQVDLYTCKRGIQIFHREEQLNLSEATTITSPRNCGRLRRYCVTSNSHGGKNVLWGNWLQVTGVKAGPGRWDGTRVRVGGPVGWRGIGGWGGWGVPEEAGVEF